MNRQPDADRFLEGWLADGPSELPDRVVDAIVRQLDDNKQRRPFWLLGRGNMNRMYAIGGIAAVLILGVVGVRLFVGSGPLVGGPTASPTPSPTPTPVSVALPPSGNIGAGRYFVEYLGYRYSLTVGDAGWDLGGPSGSVMVRHDAGESEHGILWLWGIVPPTGPDATLYADPCNWQGTAFTPGPSVDDYANAITTIATWRATQPTDVTVGGYQGKRLQLTVPADANFAACDNGELHLNPGRWYQAPGQVEDMRILEVESGARLLVFTSYFSTTPTEVRDQLNEMVNSMAIDKP